ncbi:ABC transporter permease [Microbacterium arabinogalactanolyticum]|uniref:ABC transporter permease n=1 Tax=Microbacterium arabinogalactanolyticum TaxID=69365 RepID=UPI002555FF69|nr:FtsX-like permease family protein [Microbacterium arabinogalactanolyticum]GLC84897.1 ABC transporter permease [Microbacterium arabinogalactanolyticum]
MNWLIGSLADAWAEIRVHKLRVLLSLIGIAVSVAALTAVVAVSELAMQSQTEEMDRYGGREATIAVTAMGENGPVDTAAFDERFTTVSERYGFSDVARIAEGLMIPVQAPDGLHETSARLLDPAYSRIHREKLLTGREFRADDGEALAPPVIVSEALWEVLGRVPMAQHPTLTLAGPAGGTYQIVGVRPRQGAWDEEKRVDVLFDSYASRVDRLPEDAQVRYDIWVGRKDVAAVGPALAMDLRAGLPEGQQVIVNRTDWGANPGYLEGQRMVELLIGGVAALILGLGALSLINVQLVAMRQRVREIGVRRAFGATAGRIFTTVLLESLVATTVAGVIGIAIVVTALRMPMLTEWMFPALVDVPPFPMRAAITGLVAAVIVGAVAGFVPALVALRVKVIDAIRF